jgi:hypothetical protein
MRKFLGLMFVGILLLVLQTNCRFLAGKHDVAGFDRFGPVYVGNGRPQQRAKIYSDLREFLWEHLRSRRPAYAVVTFQDPFDGVPCKKSFLVEPDRKSGRWQIKVESEITKGRLIPYRSSFTASTVQRMVREDSGKATPSFLSEDVSQPANSYFLILKDAEGNIKLRI